MAFVFINSAPYLTLRLHAFLSLREKNAYQHVSVSDIFQIFFSPFRIAVVCAILHNVCKLRNVPLPDGDRVEEEEQGDVVDAPHVGLRYRDHFANTYF